MREDAYEALIDSLRNHIEELKRELAILRDATLTRDSIRLLEHTRERALEEAARVAESYYPGEDDGGWANAPERIAFAIRLLFPQQHGPATKADADQ